MKKDLQHGQAVYWEGEDSYKNGYFHKYSETDESIAFVNLKDKVLTTQNIYNIHKGTMPELQKITPKSWRYETVISAPIKVFDITKIVSISFEYDEETVHGKGYIEIRMITLNMFTEAESNQDDWRQDGVFDCLVIHDREKNNLKFVQQFINQYVEALKL